jgi:hypothetical protein
MRNRMVLFVRPWLVLRVPWVTVYQMGARVRRDTLVLSKLLALIHFIPTFVEKRAAM